MMWILRTPLPSVSRQASTLGIMPASIAPLAISSRASLAVSEWISESGSSFCAPHAVDVAQEDQLFGPQRLGHGRGGRVGVDVQLLARSRSGTSTESPARCRRSTDCRSWLRSTRVTLPTEPKSIGLPLSSSQRQPLAEQHVGRCGSSSGTARPPNSSIRSAMCSLVS